MFHQILIYFTFALVLTTGLPQLHFHSGGLTVIENGKDQKDSPGPSKTSAPSGGQMLQIVPPGKGAPELTGHILFQVFIGSGNSDSDLVKVHESNSTFPISMAALDKTRYNNRCSPVKWYYLIYGLRCWCCCFKINYIYLYNPYVQHDFIYIHFKYV